MNTRKRILWLIVAVIATCIPTRPTLGHGGDLEGAPTLGEKAADSGAPQPSEETLNLWPLIVHRNPPLEMEKQREDFRTMATRPAGELKLRDKIKQVERELACIDIEYQIARKRDERNTMLSDGQRDQAVPLDREIRELKQNLVRCRASLSAPAQSGPATQTVGREGVSP